VQIICILSIWCHYYPIISCFIKIWNGLPFCYQLTLVIPEMRPNICSCFSSGAACATFEFRQFCCILPGFTCWKGTESGLFATHTPVCGILSFCFLVHLSVCLSEYCPPHQGPACDAASMHFDLTISTISILFLDCFSCVCAFAELQLVLFVTSVALCCWLDDSMDI